jgi:hypothetical protein
MDLGQVVAVNLLHVGNEPTAQHVEDRPGIGELAGGDLEIDQGGAAIGGD